MTNCVKTYFQLYMICSAIFIGINAFVHASKSHLTLQKQCQLTGNKCFSCSTDLYIQEPPQIQQNFTKDDITHDKNLSLTYYVLCCFPQHFTVK